MAGGGLNMDPNELELLFRRIHSGEINVFNLPVKMYNQIAGQLAGAVKAGFNLDWDKVPINSPDWETVRAMQHNCYVFSAAKEFHQINDMTNALFDGNGNARPFRLFEKDANRIFDKYNKTWLKAEFATAKEAGRAAKRWNRIEETADIFPFLEYRTRRDSRVRPEHAEIDGVILPVNDSFWHTHTPPNGWGCNNRCRLIKRRDVGGVSELEKVKLDPKETPDDLAPEAFIRKDKLGPNGKPILIAPNPKLFNLNFGRERIVFPEKSRGLGITSHPYFRVHKRFKVLKDNNFNLPIPENLKPPKIPITPPILPKAKPPKKPPIKPTETTAPGFTPAKTINEAEAFAKEKGVLHVDYKNLSLEHANAWNEALTVMPKKAIPDIITDFQGYQRYTGRKIDPRWNNGAYGVSIKTEIEPFKRGFLPDEFVKKEQHLTNPYTGKTKLQKRLNIVAINKRIYKTPQAITDHKNKINTTWKKREGNDYYFNKDGKLTHTHELGHVFVNNVGNNHFIRDFEPLAKDWYRKTKIGHLKSTNEAFADAWAEYYGNKGRNLPKDIKQLFDLNLK